MEIPDLSPPRAKWGLAVAAVLVIAAVALDQWPRHPAEPVETGHFPRTLAPVPIAEPRGTAPSAVPASDFDKLIDLFREVEAVPAAAPMLRQFTKEFQETPELRKEWDEFEKDQRGPDPKETLKDFTQTLSEKQEFRQLVARFAQDPGFRGVALQLSASPAIRDAIGAVLSKARSDKSWRAKLAASWGAGGPQQGLLKTPSRSAASFDGKIEAGKGLAASAPQGPPSQTALAKIPNAHAAGGTDVAQSSTASDTKQQWQAQPAAHDVDPHLATLDTAVDKAASKFCVSFPQFKPFCTGEPPHLLPEFEPIEGKIMTYGLWGACFVTGKYESCKRVCTGACETPDAWDACMEAYDSNDLTCLKECQANSSWCVPNEQVVEDRCVRRVSTSCTPAVKQGMLAALPAECGALKAVYCAGDATPPTPGDSGKPGNAWLGYDRNPTTGKYTIDPDEQAKIQLLFKMRNFGINGGGPMSVDAIWDWVRKNMPIERGNEKFAENRIGQLLKRKDMYCGRFPKLPKVLKGDVAKAACGK